MSVPPVFYYYLEYLNVPNIKGLIPYLVVCNFGPGNPDTNQRPYIYGDACTECADEYPLCTNLTNTEMPPPPPSPGEPRFPRGMDSIGPLGQTGSGSGSEDDDKLIGLCCKTTSPVHFTYNF